MPFANVTFFARWHATVTFNPNGAPIVPTTRSVVVGTPIGALPNLFWSGHTFRGWSLTPGGPLVTNVINFVVNNNITLYANWSATITFNANGVRLVLLRAL